jgi:hypothetical protein
MMASKHKEATIADDRSRFEMRDQRRTAKVQPAVTREHVDVLMAALSPEGRATVITAAVQRLRVRPNLPWLRR